MKRILVTGGTGNLGKWVIEHLLEKNYDVSILSTREKLSLANNVALFKGDLAKNIGLAPASDEAEIVIHCASNPRSFEHTDIEGTRNLLRSINRERTQHFVYISIVGVDKSDYPYYKAKYAVEKMTADSGIPYTILRTTQFHGFILSFIKSFVKDAPGREIKIPVGMKFQSVDIREVDKKLVGCLDKAEGLLPDFGGSEVLNFEEMVQNYLDIVASKSLLSPTNIGAELYELFRSGVNLCPENAFGKLTWQRFLEDKIIAQ